MDEKVVIKKSINTFIVFLLGSCIVGIIMQDYTYPFGLVLGYLINLLTFKITVQATSFMLEIRSSRGIVTFSFLFKILIYLLGFYIAYLFSNFFDIISVFIGYLIIKVTIIIVGVKK